MGLFRLCLHSEMSSWSVARSIVPLLTENKNNNTKKTIGKYLGIQLSSVHRIAFIFQIVHSNARRSSSVHAHAAVEGVS